MLSTSGIKYLGLGLICAIGPSQVYLVRVVQEATAGFFRDCSAVQVRASKILHKLEHITLSNIKKNSVCGGGWGRGLPWAKTTHQNRAETIHPKTRQKTTKPKRPTTETARTETVQNLCSCAMSAFLGPGIGRYIGHWPMPSRRVAEFIAASLILNIAICETLSSGDNISRTFGSKSDPTKC